MIKMNQSQSMIDATTLINALREEDVEAWLYPQYIGRGMIGFEPVVAIECENAKIVIDKIQDMGITSLQTRVDRMGNHWIVY